MLSKILIKNNVAKENEWWDEYYYAFRRRVEMSYKIYSIFKSLLIEQKDAFVQ